MRCSDDRSAKEILFYKWSSEVKMSFLFGCLNVFLCSFQVAPFIWLLFSSTLFNVQIWCQVNATPSFSCFLIQDVVTNHFSFYCKILKSKFLPCFLVFNLCSRLVNFYGLGSCISLSPTVQIDHFVGYLSKNPSQPSHLTLVCNKTCWYHDRLIGNPKVACLTGRSISFLL